MVSKQYLAGFFDGEGCVIIADRKPRMGRNRNYYLQVVISQKKVGILHQIKSQYPVSFIQEYHDKSASSLVLRNQHAAKFLEDILPFLVIKKDEAILALGFYKRLNQTGRILQPEELDIREEMKKMLQGLKKCYI